MVCAFRDKEDTDPEKERPKHPQIITPKNTQTGYILSGFLPALQRENNTHSPITAVLEQSKYSRALHFDTSPEFLFELDFVPRIGVREWWI